MPNTVGLLSRFRHLLVSERDAILESLSPLRPGCNRGELVSSELVPLLDACRFLEQESTRILQPRKLGRAGQPLWLWGVESVVYHEPLGRILILAPSNYPLFLPIVQACYAWAAGNDVWLKSAPGSHQLHSLIQKLYQGAGGSEESFRLLGEDNASYGQSLPQVQKVVLVGSAQTGSRVLAQAGEALVPTLAELSGWDIVLVHPEADMRQAARAVAFGLSLNRGRTCVAPRRVLLRGDVESFEAHFQEAIQQRPNSPLSTSEQDKVRQMVSEGAKQLAREPGSGPILLSRVSRQNPLLTEEDFGPLAVLRVVESDAEALEIARACDYSLGASLFGPEDWAQELAHQVPAQTVSINDLIVPTADPRVPFGGSGKSGYGRMRGAEGLLEMTQTRTVSSRCGGSLDHLMAPGPLDDLIVEKFLLMSHSGSLVQRAKALVQMISAIARERIRKRRARRRGQTL